MIHSDNLFLIRSDLGSVIEQKSGHEWVVIVSDNGDFQADFIKTNGPLDVTVILAGEGAKCQLNCAYLCNDNNKIYINFKVLHKSGKTISSQQIKGLSTGHGQVAFNGTITIPYDSQKCDGQQNHRGIILSDTAKISATPELEIWADDVKCAHGSAIGPLDKEQLFYLQTRGIPMAEAKKLLLSSYFNGFMTSEFDTFIHDWMAQNV